jgi:hypothetical protein
MSRIVRRIAGTIVPVVATVAALVAFGAPAQAADPSAKVAWQGGTDYAQIKLNAEAVKAVESFGEFDIVDGYDVFGMIQVTSLCDQIDGVVNGFRRDAHYQTFLNTNQCIHMMQDCVDKTTGDQVEIDVYWDLTYWCTTYRTY